MESITQEQSLMVLLEWVRQRPHMYLMRQSAWNLEELINGWRFCLAALNKNDPLFESFQDWLDVEKHGNVQAMHALYWKIQELGEHAALQWFFDCFDEYVRRGAKPKPA